MRLGFIYSLSDPDTGLVRYIGQTILTPNRRYSQHIYQWRRSKKLTHVNSWIKSLHSRGAVPRLQIIEENIVEEQLDCREILYIKLFKSIGARLCNHTNGGGGMRSFKQTVESREKRLASILSSNAWSERSSRMSIIMKEKYKMGLTSIGYHNMTDEQRERLRLSHGTISIVIRNKETNELLSFNSIKEMTFHFGYKHSETVRDFIYSKRVSRSFKNYHIVSVGK